MLYPLSPEFKKFVTDHLSDDTDKLLLNARHYPGVDMPFAVTQILARRQVREKLPEWFAQADIVFPSRLAAEQCSSETTARYKQNLIKGKQVCDLTGGLGVDAYFFSRTAEKVVYIERLEEYCRAAEENFRRLGATNIRVLQGDAREQIGSLQADTFYIDPARRSGNNKRLFALSECEPDILSLKDILLQQAKRLIVKISPMADLTETLRLLPETTEIHILSIRNECKEILFVLEPFPRNYPAAQPRIKTVNFPGKGDKQEFEFLPSEEKEAGLLLSDTVEKYLYEPNAALLKSGAFKLTAQRYGLKKLHLHSHLYTSEIWVREFPGRYFEVVRTFGFSGKQLKSMYIPYPQANITIRNFPMTVAQLRKNSGITEGGNIYLFATTIGNARRIWIECRRI